MSVRQLLCLNKLFKLPKHPFNMQQNGEMTYAEWQFFKGQDTIKFYLSSLIEKYFQFLDNPHKYLYFYWDN